MASAVSENRVYDPAAKEAIYRARTELTSILVAVDTANNYVTTATGTVALPSHTFSTDLDTGMYSAAANTPAIAAGGVDAARFQTVASAVNYLNVTPAAASSGPAVAAAGSDTNIPITLAGKGTGHVVLGQATSTDVRLAADQFLGDSSGNELIKFSKAATAVNEVTVGNAATGSGPSLTATGGDTNIPITLAGKGTGHILLGQATSTDVRLVADQPIADSSGNEFIKFTKTATAVNEITVTNQATGSGPSITATGGDANIPITLAGKGTGHLLLGQATSTDIRLVADQPIADSSGNELIKFVKTATAVNEITVTNQAAASAPSLSATGGDTNIGLSLLGKGTGLVTVGSTGTAAATAGAATSNTQRGTITSEALTTAAAADYVLTLTNDRVAAASIVLATVDNGTNTTEGLAINRVTPGAGSVVIRVRNTHASSALNGTIKVNYAVM